MVRTDRGLAVTRLQHITQGAASERHLVVVVDDDPDICIALHRLFCSEFRVATCSSGERAVELVDSDCAVVILDLKMPKRDGFSTYRALKRRLPNLPIIFYSAYQDVKDPYDVLNEYKPFAYVSKASSIDKLREAVQEAVAQMEELQRFLTVSSRLLTRTLKELVESLNCSRAVFAIEENTAIRIECIINNSSHARQGLNRIQYDDDLASHLTSENFRLEQDFGCDNTVGPGRGLRLPINFQGKCVATIFAMWDGVSATTPEKLQEAQQIVQDIAFAATGSQLYIRQLEATLRERSLAQREICSQLLALQARMNPHFLFNCLNTIAALIPDEPAKAEQVVLELSRVLRYALRAPETYYVRFAEEMAVVNDYLGIEKIRFGGGLSVALDICEESLDLEVPSRVLLPLVENAISHGIAGSRGGRIEIAAAVHGKELCVSVRDNGPGFGHSAHIGTQSSWEDLCQRLDLLYGDRASATRQNRRGGGAEVLLTLPLDGRLVKLNSSVLRLSLESKRNSRKGNGDRNQ